MLVSRVSELSPQDRLSYWIKERESVRRKKESGRPRPWTDDEILNTYRFCNVRRMDDKVSQWLLDNWYTPHRDHHNILSACALARFINLPSSLERITKSVFSPGRPQWKEIQRVLREHRDRGNTVFNGAYMVRGNDGIDKVECVVEYYVRPLVEKTKPQLDTSSMEACWLAVLPSFGMGSFMAGQIVADLRWAVSGSWEDRNTWAPMGPGSKRGMNRLLGEDKGRAMKQEEFLEGLLDMMKTLKATLPQGITGKLEAIDYQNCLCEFDKYNRALSGEGKPKQLYRG